MRFTLRHLFWLTLVVALATYWLGAAYRTSKAKVNLTRAEVAFAVARQDGSRRESAGQRHAELRLKREDAAARQSSVIYRLVTPLIERVP
jgi:hypothetical protein